MGAVVDAHADWAVVTSDNPRKEQPEAIINDILPGMPRKRYEVIVDRKSAIQRAIEIAGDRDIVLLAGKGHEAYQEFADETIPFDDARLRQVPLRTSEEVLASGGYDVRYTRKWARGQVVAGIRRQQ
jgi:UDP-N-acetylmuramoyl-L-alanyl-D-glutamate--2,6-diaminopimelate ligase